MELGGSIEIVKCASKLQKLHNHKAYSIMDKL